MHVFVVFDVDRGKRKPDILDEAEHISTGSMFELYSDEDFPHP